MIKKFNAILITPLLFFVTLNTQAAARDWQEIPRPVRINAYTPGPKPITQANWFWGIQAGINRFNTIATMNPSNFDYCANPLNVDYYTTKKSKGGLMGLEGGRLWQRRSFWFPAFSTSLRYRYLLSHNIGAQVTQFATTNAPSFNYTWKLGSNVVTAQGKVNLLHSQSFLPFISGGLGIASTTTKGYSETPIPPAFARVSPQYGAETNNNFTYNFGLGFDLKFNRGSFWTLGYEHQNLGLIESDYGVDQWSQAKLKAGKVTSHMFFVGYSHLF